jgi:hypothetical protein
VSLGSVSASRQCQCLGIAVARRIAACGGVSRYLGVSHCLLHRSDDVPLCIWASVARLGVLVSLVARCLGVSRWGLVGVAASRQCLGIAVVSRCVSVLRGCLSSLGHIAFSVLVASRVVSRHLRHVGGVLVVSRRCLLVSWRLSVSRSWPSHRGGVSRYLGMSRCSHRSGVSRYLGMSRCLSHRGVFLAILGCLGVSCIAASRRCLWHRSVSRYLGVSLSRMAVSLSRIAVMAVSLSRIAVSLSRIAVSGVSLSRMAVSGVSLSHRGVWCLSLASRCLSLASHRGVFLSHRVASHCSMRRRLLLSWGVSLSLASHHGGTLSWGSVSGCRCLAVSPCHNLLYPHLRLLASSVVAAIESKKSSNNIIFR